MMRQHGFTLVEVLIALAILALTMGAFISGASQYANNANHLREKTLATWVARNKLVEYQLTGAPENERTEGRVEMGRLEWEWRTEVSETPDEAVERLDVRVYRLDGETGEPRESASTVLTGFVTEQGQ